MGIQPEKNKESFTKNLDSSEEVILHVIAIGASAGGLEALQEFLAHLPLLSKTCIVIAQHLSPTHKSMLVQLLGRGTMLSVEEALNGSELQSSKIYITPPDKEISIIKGKIKLVKPVVAIGPKPSVDVLFESLAEWKAGHVVGIILSGTGSDGSAGVLSLKKNGAYIIAQEPETAKYDGMPLAAIKSGMVDAVLSPDKIGEEISEYLSDPKQYRGAVKEAEGEKSALNKILALLSDRTGSDFSNYKSATIGRRLRKRMSMLNILSVEEYLNYLERHPRESEEMFNTILIGVTTFFRDSEAFVALEEQLRRALAQKTEKDSFRVWIPGCSTGEEPFTIAILIHKILQERQQSVSVQIFATDVDERAIAKARKGIFQESSLKDFPEILRDQYFVRKGKEFELEKSVRSMVLFSRHDVLRNPPFLKLDLISCRNLLIYFNAVLQQQVIPVFHYALNPNATLFLGKSETVGGFSDLFVALDPRNKIYQRKRGGGLHQVKLAAFKPLRQSPATQEKVFSPRREHDLQDLVKETLFQTFEHPYVIVNEDFDIQEVNGDVRLFISLNSGSIHVNLIKMLNPELQIEVRSILTRSIRERVVLKSLIKKFELFGHQYFVRVIVKPMLFSEALGEFYIVIFEKVEIDEYVSGGISGNQENQSDPRLLELERELEATKEHLQTYIEEIETTNEELQSLNEELQSTNEELQSSNEELETANEELQSTNEEVQIAYSELKSVHEELERKEKLVLENQALSDALLSNELQAFVLLDTSYHILKFNLRAKLMFIDLMGRQMALGDSIVDFIPKGQIENFIQNINTAIQGKILSDEKSFLTNAGEKRWYSLNFSPVIYTDGLATGVSLGILDVTDLKITVSELNDTERLLSSVFNAVSNGICVTDENGIFVDVNDAYCEIYSYTREELIGNEFTMMVDPKHRKWMKSLHNDFILDGSEPPMEVEVVAKDGRNLIVKVSADLLISPNGKRFKVTSVEDVTNLKVLEHQLDSITKNIPGVVLRYQLNPDGTDKLIYVSGGSEYLYGMNPQECMEDVGRIWSNIYPEFLPEMKRTITESSQTLQNWFFEMKYKHPDGTDRWQRASGNPKKLDDGIFIWDTIILDITREVEIKRALQETEKRFENMIQEGVEMISILDQEGKFQYLSPSYHTILGYDPEELKDINGFSLIHPDDYDRLMSDFLLVFSQRKVNSQPYRIKRKDDVYIWLKSSATNLLDDSTVNGIIVNSTDVSELVHAEQGLQLSEKQYKYLFENNPAPMLIWDLETYEILNCNDHIEKLYGYSREEFFRMTVLDLRPNDYHSLIISLANKQKTSSNSGDKIYLGITTHLKKSGEEFQVDVNAQVIDYEGKKASLVLIHDVTASLEAERALIESEEKYRSVFNLSPLSKWIYRIDTLQILDVNETALTNYGYSLEEFLNIELKDFRPVDQKSLWETNQSELKNRIGSIRFGEFTYRKKDGTLIRLEITGQNIRFKEMDCMIVVSLDITEKVQMQQLEHLELGLMEESISLESDFTNSIHTYLLGLEDLLYPSKFSLVKIESNKLFNVSSPGIPPAFLQVINGAEIGPEVESYGFGALMGERVITPDIDQDPKWDFVKHLLIPYGLKACCSLPIFNTEKNVIAILSVFYPESKVPTDKEMEIIFRSSSLVSVLLENQKNSEDLKISNERNNYVNLATNDGIYDWDIFRNELHWGKSYERLLGYGSQEIVTAFSNWESNIHPEDLQRVQSTLDFALKDPSQNRFIAEYRYKKGSGEYAYISDRGFIIRSPEGTASRMIGALSDVTQQKNEELRLKLMESVITNANDSIIITEGEPYDFPGPKIIFVNEAFSTVTGYTAEEVIGKSPRILQGPKTDRKELKRLRKAIESWNPCEITVINYKKSGEEFWVNFSISPVADSSGYFTHWISVQRDVTEKKNEELKKAVLADIVQLFSVEYRFKAALDLMNDYLVNYGGFDLGEVWMVNSEKSRLNLISQIGGTDAGKDFIKLSKGKFIFQKDEGLPGKVWEEEKSVLLEKTDVGKSFLKEIEATLTGINGALGIPLIFNGQLIGVLTYMVSGDTQKLHSFKDFFVSLDRILASEINRKRLEDELTQIFETAPDIICLLGFDGKFKKMNAAGIKLLGYTEEEILTQHSSSFVCPEDLELTKNAMDELSFGQTAFHFSNRYYTKSGGRIWLDWSCSSVEEEELIYAVAKNVTEEKVLQELLYSANSMARIGGWEFDVTNNSLYWSPITKAIHEVEEDFDPDVSTGISFYKDESDLKISELFSRCLEYGEPYDCELPLVTAKGKNIWVRSIGQSEIRNGKCVRVFGSIQDISPLKITQLELRSAFKEKTTILESIGDGFFSVDKNWIVTYWNKEAEKILGIPKKNILGKCLKEFFDEETNTYSYVNYYKAINSQLPVHFEVFFDPLESWFEISAYPSEIGLSVYFKDITLRKTSDELIRMTNERFEKVTQATQDAIWDWDLENDQLFWSEGYKTLFGIELDQTTPSLENWQKNIHPDDKEQIINSVSAAIEDREISNIHNEYRYKKEDGEYAFIIDRGLIIRDAFGKANRIVGAISDITERKEFEASMKNMNERLESRARELAMSNADLEHFAYVASHDLQEPLRMVTSFLTQLERKYKDQLDDKAKQYIHFAVDGAKRMRQVILDLLEYSRVGRFSDPPEEFSISEIMGGVIALQRKIIETKKAKIIYQDLPIVQSYKVPVFQVFQNLINNSLKYSKENIPAEITVASKDLGKHWEFTVADNGIGMNQENFEKIFVIFQRLHSKDDFEGNGIGLSIVKKIVENLGGKIWLESEEGAGTKFHFTIKKAIE